VVVVRQNYVTTLADQRERQGQQQTGSSLQDQEFYTRLTEHKRATRNGDANNHIGLRDQQTNHNIDWGPVLNLQYKLISMTDSGKLVH